MGIAMKMTGGAFKFVGRILTADDFNSWLERGKERSSFRTSSERKPRQEFVAAMEGPLRSLNTQLGTLSLSQRDEIAEHLKPVDA